MLTFKENLGFTFEAECSHRLRHESRYDFIDSNSTDPSKWKRDVARGPDGYIIIGCTSISYECKDTRGWIKPSYVDRDWVPRFSKSILDSKYNVIVVSNINQVSKPIRGSLLQRHIVVMSLDSLICLVKQVWVEEYDHEGNTYYDMYSMRDAMLSKVCSISGSIRGVMCLKWGRLRGGLQRYKKCGVGDGISYLGCVSRGLNAPAPRLERLKSLNGVIDTKQSLIDIFGYLYSLTEYPICNRIKPMFFSVPLHAIKATITVFSMGRQFSAVRTDIIFNSHFLTPPSSH